MYLRAEQRPPLCAQPSVNRHFSLNQQHRGSLRLLSFNIQAGIQTRNYRHYVTKSWQHLLAHPEQRGHLEKIGRILHNYDVVALQEVDGGSLRSGFINQVQFLAEQAMFPYWYQQLNRNLGKLAQHSNGLLSRICPCALEDHKLPGLIPGRGAIVARFGNKKESLVLIMLHLSLGSRAQHRQLDYVRKLIADHPHVVLMGDMNTHFRDILDSPALQDVGLATPEREHHTFPSWQPSRGLDHILVTRSLKIKKLQVLNCTLSDHLPVAMEILLPKALVRSIYRV